MNNHPEDYFEYDEFGDRRRGQDVVVVRFAQSGAPFSLALQPCGQVRYQYQGMDVTNKTGRNDLCSVR